jgi:hypothetical protein
MRIRCIYPEHSDDFENLTYDLMIETVQDLTSFAVLQLPPAGDFAGLCLLFWSDRNQMRNVMAPAVTGMAVHVGHDFPLL